MRHGLVLATRIGTFQFIWHPAELPQTWSLAERETAYAGL
jgi:hypothetical protein